jgi:hypothetical protein
MTPPPVHVSHLITPTRRRLVLIGSVSALLLFPACESQPRLWVKDGVPQEQWENDRLDCEREWMTRFATGTVNTTQDVAGCMARKGYRDATPEEYRKAAQPPPVLP